MLTKSPEEEDEVVPGAPTTTGVVFNGGSGGMESSSEVRWRPLERASSRRAEATLEKPWRVRKLSTACTCGSSIGGG